MHIRPLTIGNLLGDQEGNLPPIGKSNARISNPILPVHDQENETSSILLQLSRERWQARPKMNDAPQFARQQVNHHPCAPSDAPFCTNRRSLAFQKNERSLKSTMLPSQYLWEPDPHAFRTNFWPQLQGSQGYSMPARSCHASKLPIAHISPRLHCQMFSPASSTTPSLVDSDEELDHSCGSLGQSPPTLTSLFKARDSKKPSREDCCAMRKRAKFETLDHTISALDRWNRKSALFRSTKILLPKSFRPTDCSVLLGHKKEFRESTGNKRLREICLSFKSNYDTAGRDQRSEIVTTILKLVYESCPVGAFLRHKNGRYYEVEDLLARDKIASDLRNLLPNKYRSAKQNRCEVQQALRATQKQKIACSNIDSC